MISDEEIIEIKERVKKRVDDAGFYMKKSVCYDDAMLLKIIDEKDKVIDLILSEFAEIIGSCPADIYENDYKIDCENKECDEKECFKEYFYEKVREKDAKD